ncbi:MAG: hypothetical protein JXC35_04745 [Acholeplasmataceae bacterium]|nr:hypothetical protein [Acholeplasmataceae bacterium]
MKLIIFIMNRVEKLDKLIRELHQKGIKGATILSSTGMAQKLLANEDTAFIGSLKALFDNPRVESKVIMTVVKEDQIGIVYQAIEDIVGDLSLPNTGIVFTVDVAQVKGYTKAI